VKLTIVAVEKQ